jgi:hypothetical protein
MAAYREHLTTSSLLGVGVCASAFAMGFTPVQGVLAGTITGIGGILPDLDSESGRPIREVFGVTAAFAPLVMTRRLMEWGGNTDGAMLLAVLLYIAVRYGGATLVGVLARHRGMYHSLPAMVITGELAFLGYKSEQIGMKLLMAIGVMLGFLSHLVLDELYSIDWNGGKLRLNKFSGSAVKILGKSWPGNIFAYSLLAVLSYSVWIEGKFEKQITTKWGQPAAPAPSIDRFYKEVISPRIAPKKAQQRRAWPATRLPTPPEPLNRQKATSKANPPGRLAEQAKDVGADIFQ